MQGDSHDGAGISLSSELNELHAHHVLQTPSPLPRLRASERVFSELGINVSVWILIDQPPLTSEQFAAVKAEFNRILSQLKREQAEANKNAEAEAATAKQPESSTT